MKILKGTLILLVLLSATVAGLWFYAPQTVQQYVDFIPFSSQPNRQETALEHAKKHSDPNYVCPMHPQIVKGEPSSCPICGMDLVEKKPKQKETALEHAMKHSDPNYVCPMHPQIVKGEPSSCPICGMDLVEKKPKKQETALEHAKKHSDPNYVCPMHPQIVKDEPGSCPICGMDLVLSEPANQSKKDDGLPTIEISSTTMQQMGIKTVEVKKQKLDKMIRTIGRVAYNEDRLQHVHPKASGWVEQVYIKSLGDKVQAGKPLLQYYSPEINVAEKDLLLAKQSGKLFSQGGRGNLTESAKEKLRLLDVSEASINRVLQKGQSSGKTEIYAPQSGVVMNMAIRDGMYITPSNELYTIADLSKIWVLVDVFEDQMQWVKKGNKASIQVQGLPSKAWEGKVDYIYPELNPVTRTLTIRLVFDNPQLELRPNMFADVKILTEGYSVLSVPSNTLIYYQDSVRVVKVTDDGAYQPVKVQVGRKAAGLVEITAGLKTGDQVVESGQFLIDSESNLQASFQRMSE